MNLSIRPGTKGSIQFEITGTTAPEIGYDEKPWERQGIGPWGMIIQSDWNAFSEDDAEKAAIKASQDIHNVVDDVKKSIQHVIDSLSNGKVILPLGELYTYKNVRLYKTENTDDNAVTFDVGYAPVTGS